MSNIYCSVPGCKSWLKKCPDVSFHRFPIKGKNQVLIETKLGLKEFVDRHTMWVLKLKIGKPVSTHMRICSLHFKDEDILPRRNNTAHKFLKRNAIPTQTLPLEKPSSSGETSTKRVERIARRAINKSVITENKEYHCSDSVNDNTKEYSIEELEAAEGLLTLLTEQPNYNGPKTYRDFEIQVNTPKRLILCDLINSDSALTSFTGLCSFALLDLIVELVQKVHKDARVCKLDIKERVILTFVKLKLNISYITLCQLFGISAVLCKQYFVKMLPLLASVLQPIVKFPSKDEIKQNMPKCFEDFANVRILVDCTEIIIEKPKCLCCRIRFYSHYKSCQTVKFMIGVSPAGLVTFISKGYGGRASDKTIFEQSDLI